MTPINRLPRGLLDFLGIRSGGRYPQVLTEQLLPVLELGDWYDESNSVEAQTAPIIFNTNQNGGTLTQFVSVVPAGALPATVRCPQNEVWRVKVGSGLRWRFQISATGVIAANLCTLLPGPVTPFYRSWPTREWGSNTSNAALFTEGGCVLTNDIWVHPNEEVRIQFGILTGVAVGDECTLEAHLSIVRFRI